MQGVLIPGEMGRMPKWWRLRPPAHHAPPPSCATRRPFIGHAPRARPTARCFLAPFSLATMSRAALLLRWRCLSQRSTSGCGGRDARVWQRFGLRDSKTCSTWRFRDLLITRVHGSHSSSLQGAGFGPPLPGPLFVTVLAAKSLSVQ